MLGGGAGGEVVQWQGGVEEDGVSEKVLEYVEGVVDGLEALGAVERAEGAVV